MLSFEKTEIGESSATAAIMNSTLHLIDHWIESLGAALLESAEPEVLSYHQDTLGAQPQQQKVATSLCDWQQGHCDCFEIIPIHVPYKTARRSGPSREEMSIKSLAPRLEDSDRYRMSKDNGKTANQASLDRSRREFKREHKADARERIIME